MQYEEPSVLEPEESKPEDDKTHSQSRAEELPQVSPQTESETDVGLLPPVTPAVPESPVVVTPEPSLGREVIGRSTQETPPVRYPNPVEYERKLMGV